MRLSETSLKKRLCACFCFVLAMVLAWRWQRIFFLMCNGDIISDMPAHIGLALGNNDYTLASYIVRALYALFDEHRALTLLSVILSANMCFGLVTVWLMIKAMFPGLDKVYCLLAAMLAHLCGPWIIPGVQMEMYLGVYNGNIYHNMTVLFSRSFIPLCFMFFFRLWDERHGRTPLGPWLGMTLSFLVCTLFKPNFAFAFIPMLGAWLVYDFLRHRARFFKNEVLLGLTVVPAGLACIGQYLVLFADNFAGTSSSMVLRSLAAAEIAALALMYLRGLLLPIFSLSLQTKQEPEQRQHILLMLICNVIAILEACLITESGYRANDGNLDWGSLSMYPAFFALAIALLFRMIQTADMKKRQDRLKLIVGLILLLGHLVVGVYCLSRPGNAGYDWFYF